MKLVDLVAGDDRVPGVVATLVPGDDVNLATQEVAQTQNVYFVDLEAALPKSTQYMYDDVHHTEEGAMRVAETLLDQAPWDRLLAPES